MVAYVLFWFSLSIGAFMSIGYAQIVTGKNVDGTDNKISADQWFASLSIPTFFLIASVVAKYLGY